MVRQLLGDVEEYVAKEEEHGAQEEWTEGIRWVTETVLANDAAICIAWSTLYLQFDQAKDCVKISFNCEVYNVWGTLQWPLQFK